MKTSRSKPFSIAAFAAILAILVPVTFISNQAGAATTGGGLTIPDIPKITDVICLTGCSKVREGSVDGTVQVTGSDMSSVGSIAFRGEGKNIRVEPSLVTRTRVEATVPEGAISGRVRVITASGSVSSPSAQILAISNRVFSQSGKLTITDASTTPSTAFQFGLRRPTLSFVVNGADPTVDLRVDVVNRSGDVVQSRFLNGVPTGSSQKVAWNGRVAGKRTAPNGAYKFVVRGNDGTAATISARLKVKQRKAARATTTAGSAAADPFGFRMFAYIFPLRGAHSYGDGIGAGRGHQGADVLANCGQPLVAARAGTVYYNDYQADGAGNYLVINVKGGGSHVYMHMPARSPLKVGTQVKTGQRIGSVGTTGRSTACHLHFEAWSAPGWYQGGTFQDSMSLVRSWDRYS